MPGIGYDWAKEALSHYPMANHISKKPLLDITGSHTKALENVGNAIQQTYLNTEFEGKRPSMNEFVSKAKYSKLLQPAIKDAVSNSDYFKAKGMEFGQPKPKGFFAKLFDKITGREKKRQLE